MSGSGRGRRTAGFVAGIALVLGACSGSGGGNSASTVPAATTTTTTIAVVPTLAPVAPDDAVTFELGESAAPSCDPLDSRACLLPFPSDFFTVEDPTSDTGRRVSIATDLMPRNAAGTPIDATEWNRNDGFSPNSPILTYVDALDPVASRLPAWTDIAASLADDSPIAIIDMATGERMAFWAELDTRAASPADQLLTIRPAAPLPEGHRFAVALRGLVRTDGAPVEPTTVFRAYRDRLAGPDWLEARRESMEGVFAALGSAGVTRDDLTVAWSFTVASTRSLAERMLGIRDDALQTLGDDTPTFTVDEAIENLEPDALIARRITGTVEVPNYLTGDGSPGNGFFYGADGAATVDALPEQNGTLTARFTCTVPNRALEADAGPSHLVLYGHGLLGSDDEVTAANVSRMADEHNVVHCATKWAGMSEDDIPNAIATLQDFSTFGTVADRLQQGVLNAIFLGRVMTSETGLAANPAFAGVDLDLDHLDFDGNSQGAIMGLMLAAVSPDIERAVLGVAGMNYSLLLPRSVDFDQYEAAMRPAYPNDLDRLLVIALAQSLWDRGEGAGYAQHVTSDPYPGTPSKQVLLHVAIGDHQVSPLSALVGARALGARYVAPLATPGRLRSETVTFGLDPVAAFPDTGSAIVFWDSGASEIPLEPIAPREGRDPHEDPRADADARAQKAAFLFEDELIDVCAGAPCTAEPTD